MNHLYALILLCMMLPFSVSSFERTAANPATMEDCGNQKCICLELGGERNTFTIVITEGDSICNVHISDAVKGWSADTVCEKAPILVWGFNDLKKDLEKARYKTDNDHNPIFFTLSLMIDGENIFVTSERKRITGRKLRKKVQQLGTFIFSIYMNEYRRSYPVDHPVYAEYL